MATPRHHEQEVARATYVVEEADGSTFATFDRDRAERAFAAGGNVTTEDVRVASVGLAALDRVLGFGDLFEPRVHAHMKVRAYVERDGDDRIVSVRPTRGRASEEPACMTEGTEEVEAHVVRKFAARDLSAVERLCLEERVRGHRGEEHALVGRRYKDTDGTVKDVVASGTGMARCYVAVDAGDGRIRHENLGHVLTSLVDPDRREAAAARLAEASHRLSVKAGILVDTAAKEALTDGSVEAVDEATEVLLAAYERLVALTSRLGKIPEHDFARDPAPSPR